MSDVYKAVDAGSVILLSLLDFSAAFDTVVQRILLNQFDIATVSEAGHWGDQVIAIVQHQGFRVHVFVDDLHISPNRGRGLVYWLSLILTCNQE